MRHSPQHVWCLLENGSGIIFELHSDNCRELGFEFLVRRVPYNNNDANHYNPGSTSA